MKEDEGRLENVVVGDHSERKFVDAPPIDMAHLTRHTLGDEEIAREVLDLFLIEMRSAREVVRGGEETELRAVAHRIKGAARAVGAFGLAEIAARIEDAPEDGSHVDDFNGSAGEIERYILSLQGRR